MSTESRKVLQLLAEGKITIDDAERLLDKLAQLESRGGSPWPDRVSPAIARSASRILRVALQTLVRPYRRRTIGSLQRPL